ncbi:MAG: hypothetical protein A3A98_00900 [Candidatus Staskawiczbacteria bacterium RIFCSPLOWO2_01_FULL_40_39]|uniref:Uncharacterized protein n=1 Tax=Candidatus Staskawiczbacteria bacterium RIFCSPHIGHO2_01_FULL_39_25 TaxID=1802202 RepID=A0A1G2HNH4_9BACT|nr:MAG: hypothetical protein A2730_00900 [Candidatus Staskawiczbacteria bacterium RIFCSPHIGHO2_01_FULL_39_25]OGZ73288.1 MAG: hypothetical protein A3A98_00900 [Candidatus Staskawiczbacteria bacterium RIFCSPLOWO2_01_FULL_40_39]
MDKKIIKWGSLGATLVVLAVFYGVYQYYITKTPTYNEQNNTATTQNESNEADIGNNAGGGTTNLTYTQAVKLYVDKRIQFNDTCVASPNYVVFKKGTTIMLDNRSNKQRVISLDGVKYNLKPYGFVLVTLTTTAKLPHTIMIDCGTGQNNARILLQS